MQNLLEDLIINNNETEVRALLLKNHDLINQETSFGVSIVMLSCYYKKTNITEILVEFVDLNIFEAAAVGKFDVLAHHIFKKPENINNYSADGFTPLGLASYFGNQEIAKYLILKGADVNLPSTNGFFIYPLHSAIAGNFTEIAKMLVQNNSQINCVQKAGITPLHVAAENGNIEIIILLLENGADLNIRMDGGKLPCTIAKEKGFLEIAEILGN